MLGATGKAKAHWYECEGAAVIKNLLIDAKPLSEESSAGIGPGDAALVDASPRGLADDGHAAAGMKGHHRTWRVREMGRAETA